MVCRRECPCKFCHYRLNSDRISRLLVRQGPFVQYLMTFCSRLEAAGDVISGTFVGPIVPDKSVKCRDPSLNRSQEIPPEAIRGGICR